LVSLDQVIEFGNFDHTRFAVDKPEIKDHMLPSECFQFDWVSV